MTTQGDLDRPSPTEYRPRIVSWNVTGACHLRCAHCYLNARRRWPDELSTDEALGLIDDMASAGTELLILTGGEPLLRRDLPALARRATERGISVVLGTSGTLIDRERARTLKESGVVAAGISIDSLDAGKHDAFRGLPGAWHRAVAGIRACRAEGLEVLIHTTALRMNQHEIPSIIRFAEEQGARAFHLFFLVCTGRGEQLTDLSPLEYEALLSLVLDAQDAYPDMMVRARCAPHIGRLAIQRGAPLMSSAGCLAGTSYCRIAPNGDVTPCPYLPTVAGNVRVRSLREIWASSPVLGDFRGPQLQLGGKCGQCPLSRGDEPVCVGCRARALAMAGDQLAADPWCLYDPAERPLIDTMGSTENVTTQSAISWTRDAEERLARVPFFIRARVRMSAEAYVSQRGLSQVTAEVLAQLRRRVYGDGPPGASNSVSPEDSA